jgi:HNH endonuclease
MKKVTVFNMTIIYGEQKIPIEIDSEDLPRMRQHSWHWTKDGMRTKTKSGVLFLHRFIMDAKDGEIVEFINGDKKDCRRSNLRIRSRAEKAASVQGKTGGYIGVYKTPNGRFAARFNGKHLGTRDIEESAARLYDDEHFRRHGFRVNFPDSVSRDK